VAERKGMKLFFSSDVTLQFFYSVLGNITEECSVVLQSMQCVATPSSRVTKTHNSDKRDNIRDRGGERLTADMVAPLVFCYVTQW
jgi:hypothetical protein